MLTDTQSERLSEVAIPFDDDGKVESAGDPPSRSTPVPMPCHGPDCETIMVTYLTDEDKDTTPTAEVHQIAPELNEPRRATFWFCSDECRTAFTRAPDREVALLDARETLDREVVAAAADDGDEPSESVETDGGASAATGSTAETHLDTRVHNQIVAFCEAHPDASVPRLLAQFDLSPDDAAAVEAIIENPVEIEVETDTESDVSIEEDSEPSADDHLDDGVAEHEAKDEQGITDTETDTDEIDDRDSEEHPDDDSEDGDADEDLETETTPKDQSSDEIPGCESAEPVSTLENSPLAENPPRAVVSGTRYPPSMVERNYWVPTALDEEGRKRPRAPYITGHSYPAKWGSGLTEDERPETAFKPVKQYAEMGVEELEQRDLALPEDNIDKTLSIGAILPRERPPQAERITLIDWDDVRNPETEEIHPICAAFLRRLPNAYADISTSGTGIHQLVYGGLGTGGKFIATIDEEVFVGDPDDPDDRPQVEIYDGGRHIAMTGKHVEGTGADIVPGQEQIITIVEHFADAATALPRGMDLSGLDGVAADQQPVLSTRDSIAEGEEPETRELPGRPVAIGQPADYGGYDLDDRPDDRPRCYHAALCNRADPDHKPIANWESIYYIALLGQALDLDEEEVIEDLREYPTPGYGFDEAREPREVKSAYEHADSPPSTATLHAYGILPSPGCDPDCPAHVPGTAQVKRSGDAPGTDEKYRQMPMWAIRNVAYGGGHDPANDIWRSAETGQAVTDDEEEALRIHEETGVDLYRALRAQAHNLVLDMIEEAGRHPDEHGRSRRKLTDDTALYTPDEWR